MEQNHSDFTFAREMFIGTDISHVGRNNSWWQLFSLILPIFLPLSQKQTQSSSIDV